MNCAQHVLACCSEATDGADDANGIAEVSMLAVAQGAKVVQLCIFPTLETA
jgi:hypothetical protein